MTLETKMTNVEDVLFLHGSDYVAVSNDKTIQIFDSNKKEIVQTSNYHNYKLYDFYLS